MKKLITIIAPMYNEESIVNEFFDEVKKVISSIDKYNFEILFVNDGSVDETLKKMKRIKENNSNISIVSFSRNFGLESAIFAGLNKAKGDAVITMDADLQDPPKLFENLIKKWEDGYKVVNAKRVTRRYDNLFKRLTASLYYKLLDKLSGKLKIDQNVANYRLLDRQCVDILNNLMESNKVYRVLVPYIGFKTTSVDYERVKRFAGKTKYNVIKLFLCALDGITNISELPLYISGIFSFLCFIAIIILLIIKIVFNLRISNFTFLIIILFFFALLLISIFIISIYLSQIYIEGKKRPMHIIDEYIPMEGI